MNITISNPEVRSYLDAIRRHLSDIPERDLDDLLEDLEGHLVEVAAEDEGSLAERLGPPDVYAEELRTTAGLPSRDAPSAALADRLAARFRRSTIGRLIDQAGEARTVIFLKDFIPQLRPGWWVLRGYLAVAALAILSYEGYYTNPAVPFALGGYALGIVLVVLATIASVAIGRSGDRNDAARRVSLIVSGLVIAVTIAAIPRLGDLYVQTAYVTDVVSPQGLYHENGTPIANICPYAGDGKPLTGVLLFDHDGRAITSTIQHDDDGVPVERVHPAIPNAYPLELRRVDPYTGTTTPMSCPTILTVPQGVPTPSAGN